ncbi:peptidase T [Anaerococcus sp. AGMB09787]|uniref:peptidase T n=1 Tax=Anaerococcus sp. AGMB09787 TaxID=2922869 RepID=UPI001FAEB05F|nr:peptidase T [Anaerococcus sp. AGMB09787]
MNEEALKNTLVDNFFRYLAIPSQSKEESTKIPSSEGQEKLARLLAEDLQKLGLVDIAINDYGVLQAKFPKNSDYTQALGWVCHLDTVDVGLSDEIHPHVIKNYQGGNITLNREENINLTPDENPEILKYIGDDIIVTDGKSVLGADNKAAIANVMTAISYLNENKNIDHGDIYLAFVPDEEIGLRGSRKINFDDFNVDFAYTIDCCELGELVYETFNAASASIIIEGVSAHPMSAKNILVNPIMIANDFINLLNKSETPEHTEGKEGYIWVTDIESDVLTCKIHLNIRDHSREKYDQKKVFLIHAIDLLQNQNPKAKISIEIEDIYSNILDSVNDANKVAIDKLFKSFTKLGIKPKIIPMRGGTDGSYLSTRGILTPNYFTGAHNFHSNKEFLPINSLYKSLLVTIDLMTND